jgi:hypothetical protein
MGGGAGLTGFRLFSGRLTITTRLVVQTLSATSTLFLLVYQTQKQYILVK